jgi:D-threo-aldose 1-dehydrogenase
MTTVTITAGLNQYVLGCSQLGGLYRPMSDADAQSVLECAWESGIRHFDTAPHYGAGLSERRVGRFLRQFPRDAYTVSTKVGRLLVDTDVDVEGDCGFFGGDRKQRVLDYSADGVRRSLADSLSRLELDRVDTLYVHDPEGPWLDQAIDKGYPALHRLRAEGVVSHVGVGTNEAGPLLRFIRETDADQVMLAGRYTLLDRSGGQALAECRMRNVRVVAAGVYNSGLLADPRPGATFDYDDASADLVARAREYQRRCAEAGIPLRAAAVQFVLRNAAVSQVAVGSRSPRQLRDNLAMLRHPIDEQAFNFIAPG